MNPHPTPYRDELPDGTLRPLDLHNYRLQQARNGFDEERQQRMERVTPAVIENQALLTIRQERDAVHELRRPLASEWDRAMKLLRLIGMEKRFAPVLAAAEKVEREIQAELLPLDRKLQELANKELELLK